MNTIKERIGEEAARRFVPHEGVVGLGSGSTALHFIRALGRRIQNEGIQNLVCLATSCTSKRAAEEARIPLVQSDEMWNSPLDVTCDGADYIDIETGNAIKGLGGAFLREKIVAQSSHRLVLMVDESKILPHDVPWQVTIPVEIAKFGASRTRKKIDEVLHQFASVATHFRTDPETDTLQQTENSNYIVDSSLVIKSTQLHEINSLLCAISGVVETGIFISLATDILVGLDNGDMQHLYRFQRK